MEGTKITQVVELLAKARMDNADKKKLRKELQAAIEDLSVGLDASEFRDVAKQLVDALNAELAGIGKSINLDDILGMQQPEAFKKLGQIAANDFMDAFSKEFKGFGGDQLNEIVEILRDFQNKLGKDGVKVFNEENLKAVNKQIEAISKAVEQIAAKGANSFTKSVDEIAAAAGRQKDSFNEIENALKPQESVNKTTVRRYYEGYNKSVDNGSTWEEQYKWLVKFIGAYETYINKNRKSALDDGWSELYNKNAGGAATMKNMLQGMLDVRDGKDISGDQPWARESTLKEIKAILQGGLKVNSVGDSDNSAGNSSSNKENVNKSNIRANAYRGVAPPSDTGGNRFSSRESLGGVYFAPSEYKELADQYGKEIGGETIRALIKPLNELIVNAESKTFSDIDQVKKLSYLFPGYDQFQLPYNAQQNDKAQKYFNEMARQAGFDSLLVKEVNEGTNTQANLVDTMAVLQDRIVTYLGKLPDYYDVPQISDELERVLISQQKGTAERWYSDTINRLEKEQEAAYADKDNLESQKKYEDLSTLIPELKSARDAAMSAFDEAIKPLGGYTKEEVERGLPQVIRDTEDGKFALLPKDSLKQYLSDYQNALSNKDNKTRDELYNTLSDAAQGDDGLLDALDEFTSGTLNLNEIFEKFAAKVTFDYDDVAEQQVGSVVKTEESQKNISHQTAIDSDESGITEKVAIDENSLKSVLESITYKIQMIADENETTGNTAISGTVDVVSPADTNQIAQESTLQEIKGILERTDSDSNNENGAGKEDEETKIRNAILQELAKYGTYNEAHKAGGKRIQFNGEDVHFGSFVSNYLNTYLGQSFNENIYKSLWKEAREQFHVFKPVELTKEDAIDIIREKVPDNILDGWFRSGDSSYKTKLEELTMSDDELRNAALNIMWSNFKEFSGKNIGFNEFLNSEIPVYRGKNSERYVDGDELLAFSFDENMAKKFGNHVLETLIKPIDTLGAFQTTAEAETLVYRNQLDDRAEYQKWRSNMINGGDSSFVGHDINELAKENTLQQISQTLSSNTFKVDTGITKETISSAIRDAGFSDEIAGKYEEAKFDNVFEPLGDEGEYWNLVTGEIYDSFEQAKHDFDKHYEGLYKAVNIDAENQFVGTKEELQQLLAAQKAAAQEDDSDSLVQVVVQAIKEQGEIIAQAIKIVLPESAIDGQNGINEADLVGAFNKLTNAINDFVVNGNAWSPKDVMRRLSDGDISPSELGAEDAMQMLGMLSDSGKAKFKLASSGAMNQGVAIGENLVYHATGHDTINDINELIKKQEEAYKLGAAVPRILAAKEEYDHIYQLQTRAPGRNLREYGFDEGVLGASDEQIDRLIHTFEVLEKIGLYPEFGGDNIMYDQNKGFTMIDLDNEQDYWNSPSTAREMMDFLQNQFRRSSYQYDGDSADVEKFIDRLEARFNLSPEERLVNANTIAVEQANKAKTKTPEVKVTPVLDDGAVAKAVEDNVRKTPAVVKIDPVIDGNEEPQIEFESYPVGTYGSSVSSDIASSAPTMSEFFKEIADDMGSLDVFVSSSVAEWESAVKSATETQEQFNESLREEQRIEQADNTSGDIAELNAEASAISKKTEEQEQFNSALSQEMHSDLSAPISDVTTNALVPTDAQENEEAQDMSTLLTSVQAVTEAVKLKTRAFWTEKTAVDQIVEGEVAALSELENKILSIKEIFSSMFDDLKLDTVNKTLEAAEIINKQAAASKDKDVQADSSKEEQEQKIKDDSETIKKKNNAISKLLSLHKELGELEAKSDVDLFGSVDASQAEKEAEAIRELIEQQEESLKITDELQEQFNKAKNDSFTKTTDDKRNSELKKMQKSYEALGKAQANYAADESAANKANLDTIQATIEEQARRLKMTQEEREELEKYAISAKKAQAALLGGRAEDKDFKRRVKESRQDARLNTVQSAIRASENIQNSALYIDTDKVPHAIEQIRKLNEETEKLKNQYREITASNKEVSPDDAKKLNESIQKVHELTSSIDDLVDEYNSLSGRNAQEIGAFDPSVFGEHRQALEDAVMAATDGNANIEEYDHATGRLSGTIKTGKYEVTEFTAAARQLDGQFVLLRGSTKKLETPFEKFKRKASEILTYFGGSSLIYDAFNQVRQGIQYVRDIDSALTELKKVTDETEESYDRFLNTAAKTADKVGSTIKEIVSSTADWARLGFSMEEASQLAESTSVLLNVSEFASIEEATSALTSTMQAFGYTADQSMNVVDVMNEIGNNFAISSDGIATALQDSASALMAANNSYEEAVALIASANRVVQDPNSVGAALRTISLRLRGTSVEE